MTLPPPSACVHEAAHAVVAWAFGLDVRRVLAGGSAPHCELDNGEVCSYARDQVEYLSFLRERLVLIALAADIAEGLSPRRD